MSKSDLLNMSTTFLILAEFGGISAEWVAGSAEKMGYRYSEATFSVQIESNSFVGVLMELRKC